MSASSGSLKHSTSMSGGRSRIHPKGRLALETLRFKVYLLSAGNVAALNVLCAICLTRSEQESRSVLSNLSRMAICGGRVWLAYKGVCQMDLEALCRRARFEPEALSEEVEIMRGLSHG